MLQDKQKTINKVAIVSLLSANTLKVNEMNFPITIYRTVNVKKKVPTT